MVSIRHKNANKRIHNLAFVVKLFKQENLPQFNAHLDNGVIYQIMASQKPELLPNIISQKERIISS